MSRLRSTSPPKSAWPGVSTMFSRTPRYVMPVCFAMIVMYLAAGPVGDFIKRNPTTKMLALSFLLLIGMALIAEAAHFHIPKGYIYFAIAFSAGVEALNLMARRKSERKPESDERVV